MTLYVIEKKNNIVTLTRKKKISFNGYTMHPRWSEKKEFIKVNTITITSGLLKDNYFHMKFSISYRKLFMNVLKVLESDSSSEDTLLSLDELAKMKQILKDKYMHLVSNGEYKKMLQKLKILEKELLAKLEVQRKVEKYLKELENIPNIEEERGRGR